MIRFFAAVTFETGAHQDGADLLFEEFILFRIDLSGEYRCTPYKYDVQSESEHSSKSRLSQLRIHYPVALQVGFQVTS